MAARRFLAAFHPEAVFENTTVDHRGRRRALPLPRQGADRGRLARGLRELPTDERIAPRDQRGRRTTSAEQDLPPLEEGEDVTCTEAAADARETKPPPRYGEAALLAAMEGAGKLIDDDDLRDAMKDSGIGTPATRRRSSSA